MPWGDGASHRLGLSTPCGYDVQNALGQYTSASKAMDALICTSQAAGSVVEGFLERQESWLRRHNEACRFERPQLPVIPLGIHTDCWAPPLNKTAACRESRTRLGIRPEAQVVLLAGRLDLLTKFQPAPLIQSLAALQQTKHPELELLVYGEAPSAEMLDLWKEACLELAPCLSIHWIPGRAFELSEPGAGLPMCL